MSTHNESIVENDAQTWLGELGYAIGHGPYMPPASRGEAWFVVVLGVARGYAISHGLNMAPSELGVKADEPYFGEESL